MRAITACFCVLALAALGLCADNEEAKVETAAVAAAVAADKPEEAVKEKRGLTGTSLGYNLDLDTSLLDSYATRFGSFHSSPLLLPRPYPLAYSSLPLSAALPPTTITIHNRYAVPYAKPYAVPVDRPIPVAVPHPVPVHFDKPYAVPYLKPYAVHVDKPIAVPVDRPYPVPVARAVPVPVYKDYAVPVSKPVPVHVAQPFAVPVADPIPVIAKDALFYKSH